MVSFLLDRQPWPLEDESALVPQGLDRLQGSDDRLLVEERTSANRRSDSGDLRSADCGLGRRIDSWLAGGHPTTSWASQYELALAGSRAMHPELGAKLLGTVEMPKGAPKGHGIVNLTLNATRGTVCWTFQGIAGIGKATAAHIHKAPAGKAGPVVIPFGATYKAKGCTKAAKTLIDAIESNPNGYYVNVHTAKCPGGAIRGQLVAGMVHM